MHPSHLHGPLCPPRPGPCGLRDSKPPRTPRPPHTHTSEVMTLSLEHGDCPPRGGGTGPPCPSPAPAPAAPFEVGSVRPFPVTVGELGGWAEEEGTPQISLLGRDPRGQDGLGVRGGCLQSGQGLARGFPGCPPLHAASGCHSGRRPHGGWADRWRLRAVPALPHATATWSSFPASLTWAPAWAPELWSRAAPPPARLGPSCILFYLRPQSLLSSRPSSHPRLPAAPGPRGEPGFPR